MNDPDLQIALIRMRNEIIAAVRPPWWEKWAILAAFIAGLVAGYFLTTWYFSWLT